MGLISLVLCISTLLIFIFKNLLLSTIVAAINATINAVSLIQMYKNKNSHRVKVWSMLNLSTTLIGLVLLIFAIISKS